MTVEQYLLLSIMPVTFPHTDDTKEKEKGNQINHRNNTSQHLSAAEVFTHHPISGTTRLVKATEASVSGEPVATASTGSSVGRVVRDTTAGSLEEDSLVLNDGLNIDRDRGNDLNLGLDNGLNNGCGNLLDDGIGGLPVVRGVVEFLLDDLSLDLRDDGLVDLDGGRTDLLNDLDGFVYFFNVGDLLGVLVGLVFDGRLVDGLDIWDSLNIWDSLDDSLDDRDGLLDN